MDQRIRKAVEKCLQAYATEAQLEVAGVQASLLEAFGSDKAFLDKVGQSDAVFDDHPAFEELREVVFDLLLMNFFAADVEKLESDYLESDAWEEIEEQTIERGTELLNLLLYLRECSDEDIEPELADYLKEFLLVDEDEFQDEHRIYEPIIANQLLVDSSYGEIAKVASNIPGNQELADLFYPIMSFFHEQHPADADWAAYAAQSTNPAFDMALYGLLVAYNH
ncbi:hypothetical protein [Parapedobacter sp. 2B3]|uniref:hypothetical protein n=1 Tax=Parapedobacter sp. 2B3 TaxID=3342381 RepID=UPI0035B5E837